MKTKRTLHRRTLLLGGASALGALASAPLWIRTAFAGEPACVQSLRSLASLGTAFRRAHASGRRLLVLVVPALDQDKAQRGQILGAWLNHATGAGLAPLSLCELACATMADLRKLVPNAPSGEPLMAVVDPSALGRGVMVIHPSLPEPPADPRLEAMEAEDFERVWRERHARENAHWQAMIDLVSRAVQQAVLQGSRLPDEAAAAAAVRTRWVEGRVPGSHWAQGGGCGTTIEGVEEQRHMACGMGHVPEKARRFLYLFARAPYGDRELPP